MENPPSQTEARAASNAPWNPWWGVLYVLLIFYASQIVAALVLSIYPLTQHWSHQRAADWANSTVAAQFIFITIAEGAVLLGLYVFLRIYKRGFAAIGWRRFRLKDLGYGLIAAPVYFLLYGLTVGVASHFISGLNVNQHQEIGFDNVSGAWQLGLTFISLVVLPPLTEEILVRGFLYTSLKKAMPVIWAVIATSALFAVAHLPEGGSGGPLYIAAIDTFILSLVLIYLREKSGSLWPCIILHSIKNGIAFLALFVLNLS
jgi:membrane protease YdiL (CAAX protease family)